MPGLLSRKIVSEAQRGLFGAELSRRKRGLKPRLKGMTTAQLRYDLKESAGKDLPARASRRKTKLRRKKNS